MPALGRVGVSRKIEDETVRRRLRDIMLELNPPKGRGLHRPHRRQRPHQEANFPATWPICCGCGRSSCGGSRSCPAPVDIYEESDMIIRTIRDIFTADVDTIYIDEPAAYERAKEFLQLVMPRYVHRLQALRGQGAAVPPATASTRRSPRSTSARCRCRSGGSIVIDQTEALVAIDVNSGSFRADDSAEETAYQMNLLAAKEIARQIRLRDLGGVVVNDFIDMRKERHRRGVERALRDAVKRDRARTKILRTSPFGLIEMTRQRIRPSLKRSVYTRLPRLPRARAW